MAEMEGASAEGTFEVENALVIPLPVTPTADFAYVISDCSEAAANSNKRDEAIVNTLESEEDHRHLPLEFPGPFPDHFGVSVIDYFRQGPYAFEYEVINAAVNAPDQRVALAIRLVVGDDEKAFPISGHELRVFLQLTGFFNYDHRQKTFAAAWLNSDEDYIPSRSSHIYCNNATVPGDDFAVRIIKFVVGQADPFISVAHLHFWLEIHQFQDVLRRDKNIMRKELRFEDDFTLEPERIARTLKYFREVKQQPPQ
ncbi:hypothetical protein CSAL01_08750 [Colletotrichum salicis]|uniref:Uncharacterized protein n=1 Tax=Colletotrichum salicis TaxID=1209931 RepID=A0A135UAV9_9PEZI|nr:hypothetical protein CSAL01_08750 [Colletotrichum salicis]